MSTGGQGHSLTLTQDSYSMTVSYISSKAAGPIVTKFHIEPPWAEGTKLCSNSPVYMTNMAAMPVHGKNL